MCRRVNGLPGRGRGRGRDQTPRDRWKGEGKGQGREEDALKGERRRDTHRKAETVETQRWRERKAERNGGLPETECWRGTDRPRHRQIRRERNKSER